MDADDAFRARMAPHRGELHLHCYRLLGSIQDAEDMVQETLLAAWRGLDRYEERDSLRAWLYRIATNRCLNFLRDRDRRPREVPGLPFELPEPTRHGEPLWLEPYPDAWLAGPEARFELRETVTLAFVAAIQRLPARQRAVLVLRDVLGFHAAEVAEMLDSSAGSVNSALQRARATLEARPVAGSPGPRSTRERELAGRFAEAVESGDVDRMVSLLTDDALLTMPPIPLEYQGREAIADFLRFREQARGTPLRVVPTWANAQPAFGCYTPDARTGDAVAAGLFVLTLEGDAVSALTWFADTALFEAFGLARTVRRP
ncbi:RNA polymerase subunit sigma-70 [Solirubrobacter taibaiensis]|nr:RNA polymerase subunit sigma-70 [Solirubrobacter taibaiensis]